MEDFVIIQKLIKQGKNEEAIVPLLELSKNKEFHEKCQELLWDSYIKLGQINQALDCCNKYLKKNHEKKRIEKGLLVIEKIKAEIGEKYFLDVFKIKFLILKNDGELIDSSYCVNTSYEDHASDKNYRLIESALEGMTKLPEFKSESIYFVMISELFKKLEIYGDRKDARELIKKILEYILFYPRSKMIESYLFRYLQLKQKFQLGSFSMAFLGIRNLEFITNNDLKEYLVEKSKELEGKEKKEEEFDLATDLFKADDVQGLLARRVDEDEYFMKKIGLKKKDLAENVIVNTKNIEISKVEEDVLNRLKKYVNQDKENQKESNLKKIEMAIRKSIDMLDDQIIQESFADIIIMLKFMGLHGIALRFINMVDEKYIKDKEISEKLNFEYLSIVILMEMRRFQDAVLTVDKVLSSLPLLERENICFMYLKAESLRQLNDLKKAMAIYKWIKTIKPNYRQVRKRMFEIEKH